MFHRELYLTKIIFFSNFLTEAPPGQYQGVAGGGQMMGGGQMAGGQMMQGGMAGRTDIARGRGQVF